MEKVYIVSSFRTPIGSFNGQYSNVTASKLGSCVLFHCLQRAEVQGDDISEVIMGQVLSSGQGQNPARQAAVIAKIPPDVPAVTINSACGSGLKAIYNGYNDIRAGEATLVLAGGQENSSLSEHVMNLRSEKKLGHIKITDTALQDGLTCPFLGMHLGLIAENLASAFDIPREIQEKYAMMSQFRAAKAIDCGYFLNEVIPTHEHIAFFDINIDEAPRRDTTLDSLSQMKPLFQKDGGTITSGTSSGVGDGAAAVLLASGKEVVSRNLAPQALLVGMVQVGCEPLQMGLAPIGAIKKLLEKIDWNLEEVELFEINESFAVQTMLCANVLDIDFSKVNISGGSVALGNPIGASGARILVTLLHNMDRLERNKGIATMCIGGGMAIAIAVQRCDGKGLHATPVSSGIYEGQNLLKLNKSCTK